MSSFKDKIISVFKNNSVYFITALISIVMLITGSVVFDCYPFGNHFPLAGNGFFQSYTHYAGDVNSIKNVHYIGLIDYSTGIISNNYYILTNFLLRPWRYILYLLVPKFYYIDLFVIEYYSAFILSGITFIYYLTHRISGERLLKSDNRLISFGLAYTLSAYSISFYIYMSFYFMFLIPLIFLGVERLVYEKRILLYILSLAYFMALDAYYAFICCIFASIFFLLQKYESIKGGMEAAIRFGISSIVSAGISAAFLLPYFLQTRNSPYDSSDANLPSIIRWFGNVFFPLSEYRPAREAIVTSNLEYRANIYCGMMVALFVPAYFLIKKISITERIKKALALFIVYLSFDNELLNYIFHGFHHQWQVPNRFSFFFVFMMLLMFYDVIIHIEEISYKGILISMFISAVTMTVAFISFYDSKSMSSYVLAELFIFIYIVIYFIYIKKRLHFLINLSLIILCVEVSLCAIPSLKSVLVGVDVKEELQYSESVSAFVEEKEDMTEPFVLTERTGEIYNQNFSYTAGIRSLSYYTSLSYKQQADLLYRWGVLFANNITYYSTSNPVSDMMLHVKYHVVNIDNMYAKSPYQPILQKDNIVLCENPYVLPLGLIFEDNLKIRNFDERGMSYLNYENAYERFNDFSRCFDIDNVFNGIEIEKIETLSEDLDYKKNYYMKQEDEDGNANYVFLIGTETKGLIYLQISHSLQYVGQATEGNCDTLYYYAQKSINIDKDDIEMCVLNEEGFVNLYQVLNQNVMTDQKYGFCSISGKVNTENGGILYLAMPNLPGLKVYVDGEKKELNTFLDGPSVNVTGGLHDIKILFIPEGMISGIFISMISALSLTSFYMIKRHKSKCNISMN